MKAYYILHDIPDHYVKADVIASRYPFEGFIVVKRTRAWWGKYLLSRYRRLGIVKVMDELLLRCYWLLSRRRSDDSSLRALLEDALKAIPPGYKRPPVHHVREINSPEAEALLGELRPDVCVLTCNVILKERIFTIPPLGMLVFHPGVTPEYRGPHSAFWATLNNEFWGIGWSLLRIDKGLDTGPVLAQRSCKSASPLEDTHIIMQHKSHLEGVEYVVDTLKRLEAGEQPRVDTANRGSVNYTHPGLSDYIRLRAVLGRVRRGTASPGAPKPDGLL